MAKDNIYGQMEENIAEAGRQEDNMVREFTYCQTELREREFGPMDSETDGLITNVKYNHNK